MKIRPATIKDIDEVRQLFFNTVTTINAKDYSREQITVWASGHDNMERWHNLITGQYFFVADEGSMITGFASLTAEGYLDVFFVHKDYQRTGIAGLLLNKVENCAKNLGLKQITSDISVTARPFFDKKGFKVIKSQSVKFRGMMFDNFKMVKNI